MDYNYVAITGKMTCLVWKWATLCSQEY